MFVVLDIQMNSEPEVKPDGISVFSLKIVVLCANAHVEFTSNWRSSEHLICTATAKGLLANDETIDECFEEKYP